MMPGGQGGAKTFQLYISRTMETPGEADTATCQHIVGADLAAPALGRDVAFDLERPS